MNDEHTVAESSRGVKWLADLVEAVEHLTDEERGAMAQAIKQAIREAQQQRRRL